MKSFLMTLLLGSYSLNLMAEDKCFKSDTLLCYEANGEAMMLIVKNSNEDLRGRHASEKNATFSSIEQFQYKAEGNSNHVYESQFGSITLRCDESNLNYTYINSSFFTKLANSDGNVFCQSFPSYTIKYDIRNISKDYVYYYLDELL